MQNSGIGPCSSGSWIFFFFSGAGIFHSEVNVHEKFQELDHFFQELGSFFFVLEVNFFVLEVNVHAKFRSWTVFLS